MTRCVIECVILSASRHGVRLRSCMSVSVALSRADRFFSVQNDAITLVHCNPDRSLAL